MNKDSLIFIAKTFVRKLGIVAAIIGSLAFGVGLWIYIGYLLYFVMPLPFNIVAAFLGFMITMISAVNTAFEYEWRGHRRRY